MKYLAVTLIAGASVAVAQQTNACVHNCANDMISSVKIGNCAPGDGQCRCGYSEFGFGLHDCAVEACGAAVVGQIVAYGLSYCTSELKGASSGASSSALSVLNSNSGARPVSSASGGLSSSMPVSVSASPTTVMSPGPTGGVAGGVITTLGSETVAAATGNASASEVVVGGSTLSAGGSGTVVAGQSVSVASGGSVVIGSATTAIAGGAGGIVGGGSSIASKASSGASSVAGSAGAGASSVAGSAGAGGGSSAASTGGVPMVTAAPMLGCGALAAMFLL